MDTKSHRERFISGNKPEEKAETSRKPGFSRISMGEEGFTLRQRITALAVYAAVLLLSPLAAKLFPVQNVGVLFYYMNLLMSETVTIGIPSAFFLAADMHRERQRMQLGMDGKEARISAGKLTAAAALGAALKLFLTGVDSLMAKEGLPGAARQFPFPSTGLEWILAITAMCIVPSAVEEYFFRGVLQRRMAGTMGDTGGMLFSAAAFALIHGNIYGLPSYIIMGGAIAFLFAKDGKISECALCHATFNLTALLLSRCCFDGNQTALITMAGAAISAAILAVCASRFFAKKPCKKISRAEIWLICASAVIGVLGYVF